ncbi:MAG: sulfatase-like hydrolase/transferase, partial [Verrucomicrobiota bacterium]
SHDWAGRAEGQPFFMQVQLAGGKLRGGSNSSSEKLAKRAEEILGSSVDPAAITLPPHYPDDPVFRIDWAAYLDSVRVTDWHVGEVVKRLSDEGLLENTLVVFFTDHGISTARGKQFLYDEGTHIPLVLRGPGIERGTERIDLVEHIDVAALSLAAAGIDVPKTMDGDDVLAKDFKPKDAVFAARDRCGETVDQIRSVRTGEFLYIRNFLPLRPHLQPSNYKDGKEIVSRLRELHEEGALSELTESLLFAEYRPEEELYRYADDPWQNQNLAGDPELSHVLEEMRERLEAWTEETGDPGRESPEIYAMEVDDELAGTNPKSTRYLEFKANAELMKQWAKEGK